MKSSCHILASSRAFARARSTVAPKLFQFGNFSKLQTPAKEKIELSGKTISAIDDFSSLKIFPSVRVAMVKEIKHGYNFKNTYLKSKEEVEIKPSPVQVAAIRKINKSRTTSNKKRSKIQESRDIFNEIKNENLNNKLKIFTIAAETGSGKTWAYLSNVLSKLKEDDLEAPIDRKAPMVRSVILVPTNELIDQVFNTVNYANTVDLNLSETCDSKILENKKYQAFLENEATLGYNILKWGAGEPASKLFSFLKDGVIDVLITTPTKLQSLAKQKDTERNPFRYLYNVQYAVIDEADTLFDPSWVNDTTAIISKFSKCKDLILCSATIPKRFSKTLEKYFNDQIIDIVTPSLHKVPKQVHIKIIDSELSPFNGSKARALAQALYAIQKDGTEQGFVKRIIIFVNHKKDVSPLMSLLCTKYGQDPENVIGISGEDSPLERGEKVKPFLLNPEPLEGEDSKIKILITTDLFARGVNFQGVKNIILMDFPNNSVDLVHRIGRTGRMKQSGRVFIITDKKSKKSWIKSLPKVAREGIRIG